MLSRYKTIHILLTNVHLDCRGEGSSYRNASRDESVETGDESVETRDESIEAGEKHNNHVIMPNNLMVIWRGQNKIGMQPLRRKCIIDNS